jgi:SAM-dependent methyltransferase
VARERTIAEEKSAKGLYYGAGRGGRSFENRWAEVREIADLRPSDEVLDVGCAEGLITLEAAKLVRRVHGFDIHAGRIAEAQRLASERGVENATFEVASVLDYDFHPLSYDVALFMAVWGKLAVGTNELRGVLRATRRQLVMRVGVQQTRPLERRLEEILDVCDDSGFDALCFSRPARKRETGEAGGNLLIAFRQGMDAHVGELPRLALIPTSRLLDHPVVAARTRRP